MGQPLKTIEADVIPFEYHRGPVLTETERALVEVLQKRDPDDRNSIVDICREAHVTVMDFMDATRSAAFQKVFIDLCIAPMFEKLNDVVAATLKSSLLPGKDGYKDRELIFKMLKIFVPSQKIEVDNKIPPKIKDSPTQQSAKVYKMIKRAKFLKKA